MIKSVLVLLLFLAACNSERSQELALTSEERPVEELYNAALDASKAGRYKLAARLFEEVERQHPYSQWATQAQLMYGFTLYEDKRYDEAISALNRFIDLNPTLSLIHI
jgi:outer membrane protein assembly factor BamD